MEETVAGQFTGEIRAAAAAAYGVSDTQLSLLGDFESYVFGYEKHGRPCVLRITHPSHRTADQIEAELDWVRHLTAHGVRLARPVPSPAGSWTTTVGTGEGTFHVCSFERVPGTHPTAEEWTPELFRRWGAFLGATHRLTREYRRSPGIVRRLRWDENPYWLRGRDWIPEEAEATRRRWDELAAARRALPETPETFGICHTDLHPSNFHVHAGEIHAFDTDDCCHHWFLEDLSSVLFYGRRHVGSDPDVDAFARTAWPEVWRGYRSEFDLPREWLDRLELFMPWRRLTLFALVHMKFPHDGEVVQNWRRAGREAIDPGRPVFGVGLRTLVAGI